ncbi:transglutaminase family protein, partial [Bacteroidota bacterium]
MRKVPKYLIPCMLILLITSCNNNHFIKDSKYRAKVEKQFLKQKELAKNRSEELFEVFDTKLTIQEKEALRFLFAFMPLSDLADYKGEFYKEIVHYSLKARKELPWGESIPDDIFRHFVLPYRVNNENLDTFRATYYDDLKKRVSSLSIEDAALEINHWCHEKVTYRGADIRTSGPMATIKTGFGRCGEESTLTVSAMRAVGIPARQVYTPRWAHGDDNHAWVEVWINGQWRILGACEPDPYLDMGWFINPAARAMLIHTKAFGLYESNEEVNEKRDLYSELNVLDHYAQTRNITVKVVNKNQEAVKGAFVEFQLYNYSEFYPLSKKTTPANGMVSFKTGLGDLLIWAGKNQNFAFQKITVENTDTLCLVLDNYPGREYNLDLDIIPPIAISRKDGNKGDKDISDRLKQENKMRADYEKTFMKKEEAYSIADKQNFDRERVWDFIKLSRGNWMEISKFCGSLTDMSRPWALDFLSSLSNKDLRDVYYEKNEPLNPDYESIYWDHLNNINLFNDSINEKYDREIFVNYILGPRISTEMLRPYKYYLQKEFGKNFIEDTRKDINILTDWIKSNITIIEDANYYEVPLSPVGVYDIRKADILSAKIFLVATLRSFGIPARYEQSRKVVQYYSDGEWLDVDFKGKENIPEKAFLSLLNFDNTIDPEYYIHFTLARFDNGKYHTLEFDYNRKLSNFNKEIEIDSGYYMLVTGNRIADGSVLTNISFFNLTAGEKKRVVIKIRKESPWP